MSVEEELPANRFGSEFGMGDSRQHPGVRTIHSRSFRQSRTVDNAALPASSIVLLFVIAAFVPIPTRAQNPDTLSLRGDTSVVMSATYRPAKSPWLSVGLSAAAPGLGQIYTKNYWKVPVIWGLGGYWVYEWIHNNNRYAEYRTSYARSVTPAAPQGNSTLLRYRDFYRDQRDSFAWYLGILYFLNLVDAYVDAHLYDFDVSPELTTDGRIVPRVTATIKLPL
jgi:hypothetical protein